MWYFVIGTILGAVIMWFYVMWEAAAGFMIKCPSCKIKFNSNDGLEDI